MNSSADPAVELIFFVNSTADSTVDFTTNIKIWFISLAIKDLTIFRIVTILFFPFLDEFEVLGLSPSVLLVFRVKLEVQVSDEVLEGGNEFRHGSSSLDLKFHEASGDLSPAGLLELVDLVFHVELEA